MNRLLSPADVTIKLLSYDSNIELMTIPIPDDVLDLCDALTFSHITGKFDQVHGTVGSLASMSDKYFWRALSVWAEFGCSWYNAVDLSLLLGVHHVVIASWIERHGVDWLKVLRRKVGFRLRAPIEKTLFVDTNGKHHTEVTFSHVHLNTPRQVRALIKAGSPIIPYRTLESADRDFVKKATERGVLLKADYSSYMFARCLRRVKLYEDTRY